MPYLVGVLLLPQDRVYLRWILQRLSWRPRRTPDEVSKLVEIQTSITISINAPDDAQQFYL